MEPRIIAKSTVEKEPYIVWNTFIDIVACEDMSKMNEIQRKAALCFWYDSEMQNGGHLQYFENTVDIDYRQVIDALKWLGANSQAEILLKAVNIQNDENRDIIKSVNEYVSRANECLYDDLDNEYYDCTPDLTCLFGELLKKHQGEFILLEESI